MGGEPQNGICLNMPYTGKEYVKGKKRCGKCKESFLFWQPRGESEKWYCLIKNLSDAEG